MAEDIARAGVGVGAWGVQPVLDPSKSYLETLAEHVRAEPRRVACAQVDVHGLEPRSQSLTFEQLAEQAGRCASLFRRMELNRGDRVLLSLADPRDLLAGMVGAMATEMVPVPLQTADQFRAPWVFRERVQSIIADCAPRLAVVSDRVRWRRELGQSPGLKLAECGDVLGASPIPAGVLFKAPRSPDGCAFIQYTSGSTGRPRGVVVTHGNLAANVRAIGQAAATTADDSIVSWLPLHQDMGLVGTLLYPVAWKIPTHVMASHDFIRQPLHWWRAVAHLRATLTVGPAFALGYCLKRLSERSLRGLDLTNCRLIFCGAEPLDARLLRRFTKRFAPCGLAPTALLPVYGLAEATLAVAFSQPAAGLVIDAVDPGSLWRERLARPARPGARRVVEIVSVGTALPGHQLSIVDPATGLACGPRQLGEICVHGPSVTARYHDQTTDDQTTDDRAAADAATDDAATADQAVPRRELHTGDVGYLAEDRLYVVDRLADMVMAAGRTVAPSKLEACLAGTRGLRAGRAIAFSTQDEEGEYALHLVAELNPRSWRLQRSIAQDMSRRVAEHFGLNVDTVSLVLAGSLPRTCSGKLCRGACRDAFARGVYPAIVPLGQRAASKWRRLTRQTAPARS